ncbi:RNA polymerase sigma factor [Clostridium niameyense]|uniref:RNA polymerase sigma factor n=1 Tax=Clostridium niameyense TaxID=1622073 RepID=A0A6M0R7K8_9CLOT|nr:RNA polymerase sigma factor [Clostridium niameyense]
MTEYPIRKIKNGSTYIAEEIVRDNYDAIYKYCYWKVRNIEKAQDITQEVFLRFIKNIDHYSDKGKPRAFLYTIAKNLCINWHKQYKPEYLEEEQEIIDFTSSNVIENVTDKLVLKKFIYELSPEQQEVILLKFGQGLKIKEIASIVGVSRFIVQYRIKRALSILKRKLG